MKYIFVCSSILLHFSLAFTTQKLSSVSFFKKQWDKNNIEFLQKYMRAEMHRVYGKRPQEQYGFFIWHSLCMIDMKKFFKEHNDLFYLALYNDFKDAAGLFIHKDPQTIHEKRAIIINPQQTMLFIDPQAIDEKRTVVINPQQAMAQKSQIPIKYFFDAVLHHELVHLEQSESHSQHFCYQSNQHYHDSDGEYEADIKSGERVANPYAHYYVLQHAVTHNFARPAGYASFQLLLDVQKKHLKNIQLQHPKKYTQYISELHKALKE